MSKKSREEALKDSLEYFGGDQLAADTFVSKYSMQDKDGLYESTPDDMHHRIAKEYARIEEKFGGENKLSEEEIYNLFKDFKYIIPGGSVMGNLGNTSVVGSLSNCFVVGQCADSYASINKYRDYMVELEKRRGGVGIDLSKLRPENSKVNNAAKTSTGPVSFMHVFSELSKEVAQGGRRGALMISISGNHPDVEKFIECKQDLTKITGANISVKFSDEFMEAVENDSDYYLRWPVDLKNFDVPVDMEYGKTYVIGDTVMLKKVRARDIWNKFVHCAWNTAEPGVMYEDKHHNLSPDSVYEQYRGVTTNPCLTGNTIIAVADGRNGVTIKELADDGKQFQVYSAHKKLFNCPNSLIKNWKVEIKNAVAFKTGNKDVLEITLSDGTSFKCTPDHLLALSSGEYIEAKDSLNKELAKFFTYCPTNKVHKYRHINSITFNRQYRLISDFNGLVCKKGENIHHIDGDGTNDLLDNLSIVSNSEHISNHMSNNNSIHKIDKKLLSLLQSRKTIKLNAKKYNLSEKELQEKLDNWDSLHKDELEKFNRQVDEVVCTEDIVTPVVVTNITYVGKEDVYDLSVEDNHNFYIITKTEDDKFLNSSGVLVHNCGEIFMGKFDSCRLMHINLSSFVKDDKTFDYDLLKKVAYKNMKLCDDLVELELECVSKIIDHIKSSYIEDNRNELELWENIYNTGKSSRRAGCGATGVADAIAKMGLKLNSEEGFATVEKIFQTKMLGELKAQVDMARDRGTFIGYDFNKEYTIDNNMIWYGNNEFFNNLLHLPGLTPELVSGLKKYGRRNVSWSTMAPVGTGAIMTQGSSGIEPVFKVLYKRRKKCMNPSDRVDYIDTTGEKFTEFNVIHIPFKKWIKETFNLDVDENSNFEDLEKMFKQSPWYKCEAGDLTPEEHVRLQSIVQKYITHSISKTCNLPESATEQEISDIYKLGWKYNCKGITVYRDNCRSGVLVTKDNKDCNCNCGTLTHSAPKRPKYLTCDVKRFKNGGDKWVACVGLYNGQPYEIFTGLAEKLDLPDYVTKCSIIKNKVDKEILNEETGKTEIKKVSRYDLMYSDKDGNMQVKENIGNLFNSEFYNVSKMTSAVLRHGMPIEFVISTIKSLDFKNDTINSWKAGVIRALKSYVKDGEVHGEVCPECGGKIIRENGCKHCENCGWSACG